MIAGGSGSSTTGEQASTATNRHRRRHHRQRHHRTRGEEDLDRQHAEARSKAANTKIERGDGVPCEALEQQHAKARGKAKAAKQRDRRGGIVPGERAWNRPKDPNAVEPFTIKVENDEISLDLVAHAHGGGKRAYRLSVKRMEVRGSTEGGETGRRKEIGRQMQGGEGGRGRSGPERIGGGEGEWDLSSGGDGWPERNMPRAENGRGWSGAGSGARNLCYSDSGQAEGKTSRDATISVGVVGESRPDGVHGAPVFLGGRLFGFALQVCDQRQKKKAKLYGGKKMLRQEAKVNHGGGNRVVLLVTTLFLNMYFTFAFQLYS